MAAAVRTLKTVRPHIPMIRFPARRTGAPDPKPAAATPPVNMANPGSSPSSSPAASTATSKPIGSTPRGSGIEDLHLPKKYQRKLIDIDEMEFIERGGPA